MAKCKFCEDIKWWEENGPDKDKFKTKYFVHIGIYTWYKEQRATRGEEKGRITTGAYKINYCPVCSKKIKVGE